MWRGFRAAKSSIVSSAVGPYAARGLGILLGIEEASDEQLQRWSQTLIDGAGNFGWRDEPFEKSDAANDEMDRLFDSLQDRHRAAPNNSALSVMLNADDPIETSQIYSNIKIAIGGGINEPRDALNTILFGLLTNTDQLQEVKRNDDWERAFEEGEMGGANSGVVAPGDRGHGNPRLSHSKR